MIIARISETKKKQVKGLMRNRNHTLSWWTGWKNLNDHIVNLQLTYLRSREQDLGNWYELFLILNFDRMI